MAAVLLLFTPSAFALAPRHPMTPGHPVTPCRGAFSCRLCDSSAANGGFSTADFGAELKRRGLQTALDALEEDGPSAFKSPTKVIEYVMLCLQHRGDTDGIAEAFRFTCREAGKSSFVSGLPLSSKRVAWRTAKVVSGYASGRSLPLEDFEAEVREHYALLLGCAQWRWAVTHPATQEPLARTAYDDFLREYVLMVDETPVSIRLLYDWGSWCFLVCSVQVLEADADISLESGLDAPDPSSEGGRKRGRGGSL